MLIIQLTYGVVQNLHNSDHLRQEAYNYLGEILHMYVLLLPITSPMYILGFNSNVLVRVVVKFECFIDGEGLQHAWQGFKCFSLSRCIILVVTSDTYLNLKACHKQHLAKPFIGSYVP